MLGVATVCRQSFKLLECALAYLFVLTANLLFSTSSLVYTRFARTHGVLWMNLTKASVAVLCSFVVLTVTNAWTQSPSALVWPFLISGTIGLALGDVFLISAFAKIGSARTMLLWGFQPVFVALGSYLLFGESVSTRQLLAIVVLISCLVSFSFEGFKKHGRWEVRGLLFAITGVMLDAIGLFFTRYGFQTNANIHPLEGHFYRCCGAILCFALLKQWTKFEWRAKFFVLDHRSRMLVLLASFFGTFLALFLSLSAIQIGHLPTLAALSITTPLFTATLEHLSERKWPSWLFLLAFLQFAVGFYLLVGYE